MNVFQKLGQFFDGVIKQIETNPAGVQAVTDLNNAIKQAAGQIEVMAEAAVVPVLAMAPFGLGPSATEVVDAFIVAVVNKLIAKLSFPVPPISVP